MHHEDVLLTQRSYSIDLCFASTQEANEEERAAQKLDQNVVIGVAVPAQPGRRSALQEAQGQLHLQRSAHSAG